MNKVRKRKIKYYYKKASQSSYYHMIQDGLSFPKKYSIFLENKILDNHVEYYIIK